MQTYAPSKQTMSDDDEISSRQPTKRQGFNRKRNLGRVDSEFSSKRETFVPARLIIDREAGKSADQKLSLRRQSRSYSAHVDESDILNPQTRIRLDWKDIEYSIQIKNIFGKVLSETTILSGVSGSVSPGSLVAIMGPSGAGKSLLLQILAGNLNVGKIKGKIFMNGIERRREHLQVISLVEQDTPYLDCCLSVREILEMTAELTLPAKYNKEEKEKRVSNVLKKTGIERIVDSMVGGGDVSGISGGERRRLAIAKELLREPKVILLDEPTSGLDSASSASLIRFLRELAILDHLTIIMTIHQPRASILSKFDFFIIVSQGKTVFNGNVDEALEHYKSLGHSFTKGQNPAEFFLDTLSTSHGGDQMTVSKFQDAWTPHEKVIAADIEINVSLPNEKLTKFKPPVRRWNEIRILLKWKFRTTFRNKRFRNSLFIEYVFCFFLYMSVFFQIPNDGFAAVQNRIGFVPTISYDNAALMHFCLFLVTHRNRIIDERRYSKYRLSSFFIASCIAEIFLWAIIPIPVWIALYYIVHFRYTPFTALLIFLGMQSGYLIVALFIGSIVGSLINNLGTSIRTVNTVWAVFKIFGGTIVNTNNVSPVLAWLRYISPPYFFQSGLAQNEFIGQTINGQPGQFWIDSFGFNGASEMWCAGALMIMIGGLFVISFIMLLIRTKPKFTL